ncbi:LuxR C-terminal-related transcriptional regulator [Streptomyces sp. NRRL B-24085]|uniref:LuxR C-terminal-related transcriptional regulator n=1 Tax=Streptomyces sp. NRRL B-24085 TaxID=1709476 RepID=UPI0006B30439|nr:LuxR family transcriptional regulator [Streptomyces sp. NRRL B-24085]
MGLEWPLVGRSEELKFVAAALRSDSDARGVVLAGAPGVGKTRLAREMLARVERRGTTVRGAVATASSRMLPLGAFAGLLGDLGQGQGQAQILPRAAEVLLAGAGQDRVIVAVDDAHLLDELSAALVHLLVLRRGATVLLTVRSGEPAPDAITALWKDRQLDRLEVQPLSEAETVALLEAALGGQVDSAAAGQLWTMSRGNVLFLRQLVDGAVDRGAFRLDRGIWRLAEPVPVTAGLAELLAARMGALSDPVRDVVDTLALGEPLGVRLLAELTDAAAVEQAEDSGLIQVEADGRRLQARLAHPLYGEARRGQMGRLRARRLRSRITTALADTGARRADDTLRRAVLMLDSDLQPDPDLLTAAAESSSYLGDLPLARRLAVAAVRAGGGFGAQAIVANATLFVGRPDEADGELAALARLAGTDGELVRATVNRATFLSWILTRPAEAQALLDEVAARVAAAEDRLPLVALRAMIKGQLGQLVEAEQAARTVLDAAEPGPDAVLMACCGLVATLATAGRADEMNPYMARGAEAANHATERAAFRIPLVVTQMTGLRLAGYLDDAGQVAAECREQIKDLPLGAQIGCYLMGETDFARGRVASSVRWLREGRAGIEPFGDVGGWRYVTLIALTRALAVAGDIEAAKLALADLEQHRHPAVTLNDPERILARAWVAAAEGATSQAITLTHDAAAFAAGLGQLAHEVLALHTAVRFGDPTVADRLAALVPQVDGPRAPAAAAHAAALAAADGDALLEAAVALERFGDLLAAADAAAQAAEVLTRAGQRGAGYAAAERARRLSEACDGARTPTLAAAARPLPLTEREREIVTLAARGLSNREIAERLMVSVRTVEGHLYRASTKLGTTNRAEYAGLIGLD